VSTFIDAGWRCTPSAYPEPVRTVLLTACAEIGVCEVPPGSNAGALVERYTLPEKGIPWCAAFASYCWARVEGGSPFDRKFSALKFIEWARANGRLVKVPQEGDIACVLHANGHGHVGIVAGLLPPDGISTIEGNSKFPGEPDAVRGRVHRVKDWDFYVRPTGDL
jgi:hypothetical protein